MVLRTVTPEHRPTFTVPEYKRFLKHFDTDREGRIDRKELQEAIRLRRGACFSGRHARADGNHNGFVDDSSEIKGLVQFAERELGFRTTTEDVLPADLLVRPVGAQHLADPPFYSCFT